MIKGLDHINIVTTDLDGMIHFYEDVLELNNGERPPFDFPGAWLYAGESPVIHLVVGDKDQHTTGNIDHYALKAEGFEKICENLNKKGIPYEQRIVPNSPVRQINLKDPSGVKVELNFPEE